MHPPAWRFSLPGTVNQQCSGITEGEGCEDRDKGRAAELLEEFPVTVLLAAAP